MFFTHFFPFVMALGEQMNASMLTRSVGQLVASAACLFLLAAFQHVHEPSSAELQQESGYAPNRLAGFQTSYTPATSPNHAPMCASHLLALWHAVHLIMWRCSRCTLFSFLAPDARGCEQLGTVGGVDIPCLNILHRQSWRTAAGRLSSSRHAVVSSAPLHLPPLASPPERLLSCD